jgi:hypothetical protein
MPSLEMVEVEAKMTETLQGIERLVAGGLGPHHHTSRYNPENIEPLARYVGLQAAERGNRPPAASSGLQATTWRPTSPCSSSTSSTLSRRTWPWCARC